MLGDTIHNLLERVGITPKSVEEWLGKPCLCEDRKRRLNALDSVIRHAVKASVEDAKRFLTEFLKG